VDKHEDNTDVADEDTRVENNNCALDLLEEVALQMAHCPFRVRDHFVGEDPLEQEYKSDHAKCEHGYIVLQAVDDFGVDVLSSLHDKVHEGGEANNEVQPDRKKDALRGVGNLDFTVDDDSGHNQEKHNHEAHEVNYREVVV